MKLGSWFLHPHGWPDWRDNWAGERGLRHGRGTAQAGQDYTGESGTLSWADGDGSDKSLVIPIANDHVREDQEAFTIALMGVSGGAGLGDTANITVNIQDTVALPMAVLQILLLE